MKGDIRADLETFLVEDVILTLGNMRRALDWVTAADPGADRAQFRAGIDRQIDLIEERARDVCGRLRSLAGSAKDERAADVEPEDRGASIETAILDALTGDPDGAYAAGAIFRSQRG